jgi:hypothetical protein
LHRHAREFYGRQVVGLATAGGVWETRR